jgi:hypothetical protein
MMTEEMLQKYKRLRERLIELNSLEDNIARLAFYLNENKNNEVCAFMMRNQLSGMLCYRENLQKRIEKGYY